MRILAIILALIGGVAMLGGLASLSNATSGVGGIAVACFFGILARLAQASAHHDDVEKWITGAVRPSTTSDRGGAATIGSDALPPIPSTMR